MALKAIYPPPDVPNESDAARKCGLSPGRINDVRNKRRSLGREDLHALAKGLGISADYLLGIPGAPMFVGAHFNQGLEDAVKAYLVKGISDAAKGEAWAEVLSEAAVDGAKFLSIGIAREIERIRTAWSSTEEQSRYGEEVADVALRMNKGLTNVYRAVSRKPHAGLIAASTRYASKVKRDPLFWIWLTRGAAGAFVHWEKLAERTPRTLGVPADLALPANTATPERFRQEARIARGLSTSPDRPRSLGSAAGRAILGEDGARIELERASAANRAAKVAADAKAQTGPAQKPAKRVRRIKRAEAIKDSTRTKRRKS